MWREIQKDEFGSIRMIIVVDRGLTVSTKKREDLRRRRKEVEKKHTGENLNLNRKMTGENTLGIDVESRNLKLKTCSTPRIREDCLNVRVKNVEKRSGEENVILASLEEKRLVKQGRKI